MIKFFRKIRKKLADDNKPVKYMRYAVGEIVLVMVGILLALQVNNWNDINKTKALEIRILKEISSDLRSDITSIKFDVHSNKVIISSIDSVLIAFKSNTNNLDSLEKYFGTLMNHTVYTLKYSGYHNLKSSGFQILQNHVLRKTITELYESTYDFLQKVEKRDFETTWNYFRPRYVDYFNEFLPRIGQFPEVRSFGLQDFNTTRNDKEFTRLLKYYKSEKHYINYNVEIKLMDIQELSKGIDKELSNLVN